MQANRRIQLRRVTDAEDDEPFEVEKPSIVFGDVWSLIDRSRNGDQEVTALEDVVEVRID